MKKLMFVVGTRPEIIKIYPVVRNLQKDDFEIVHTGQHHDFNLSGEFFKELGFPQPKWDLSIADSSTKQVPKIMIALDAILGIEKPRMVVVEGDTNSVIASALAANKHGIDVAHVESGLRSKDLRMPEEHNRRLTDHLSSFLFAPTNESRENLLMENVWGAIYVTGNTVIDACETFLPIALEKSKIMDAVKFPEFILVTAHRQENVDNRGVLRNLVDSLLDAPIPVVFPVHPRTMRMLISFDFIEELTGNPKILILPPVGYMDFLVLMKNSKLIITDSGGVQEEATSPCLRKYVLVWRLATERPEAVRVGYAEVVGVDKERMRQGILKFIDKVPLKTPSPFGEGRSGQMIARILEGNIRK